MSNYPMQDPNQPPYPEQYGPPNYYPSQQPPYPPQPPTNYPAPDAGWNAPPAYPAQPGYPSPQYPNPGYPQPAPGYPDPNQPYGQGGYVPPAPGYADPYAQPGTNYGNAPYPNAPYTNANAGYANPSNPPYGSPAPNYYAAPATPPKRHTGRNIVIGLVVFVIVVGGIIGLVSLLHKGSTTQTTGGSSYPSYLPGHGTLALNDPLQSAGNWINTGDGHCVFDNNTFHVRTLSTQEEYSCWSQSTNGALNNATNSVFEAQMTIVQGDCGGIDTRISPSNFSGHKKFYLFSVCDDGNFAIFKYNVNALGIATVYNFTHSTAINQGLNVANKLDFVANGSTLTVFINEKQVASVQDNALTQGTFGLAANPGRNDVTDVSYTNAKVWTL